MSRSSYLHQAWSHVCRRTLPLKGCSLPVKQSTLYRLFSSDHSWESVSSPLKSAPALSIAPTVSLPQTSISCLDFSSKRQSQNKGRPAVPNRISFRSAPVILLCLCESMHSKPRLFSAVVLLGAQYSFWYHEHIFSLNSAWKERTQVFCLLNLHSNPALSTLAYNQLSSQEVS